MPLLDPARRSRFRLVGYDFLKVWVRLAAIVLFRVRCRGRRHWPRTGGGLVCSNHQSFYDPVLVGLACDRRLNYLARKTLFRVPGLRPLIEWFDAIPIDRDGLGLDGIKETLRRLKRGEFVLMFPEGARSPDGRMLPLKPGLCALARRTRAPLIPVGLDGAFEAWPRAQKLPGLATVHVSIGEPIGPELIGALSDEELLAELDRRMRACWQEARTLRRRALGRTTSAAP